ncbi:MAG: recO [Firmicutes bacterium]|nr:recO [Bacillota bacterium]
MAQYQAEAILLAVRDWGEADKLVTLFSREYGKISAVAYGARRPKNRMSGTLQLFSHVELSLSQGNKLDTIRQCDVKVSFRTLREDLVQMAYGVFVLELADELLPDRQPEPEIFDLLLTVLTVIQRRNPRVVALAAAWQMLALAGFQPVLDHCVRCGSTLHFPARFVSQAGGGVCLVCGQSDEPDFSAEEADFLQKLLLLRWNELEGFTVKGQVLMDTERKLIDYLRCRLERQLRSLDFIRKVNC